MVIMSEKQNLDVAELPQFSGCPFFFTVYIKKGLSRSLQTNMGTQGTSAGEKRPEDTLQSVTLIALDHIIFNGLQQL